MVGNIVGVIAAVILLFILIKIAEALEFSWNLTLAGLPVGLMVALVIFLSILTPALAALFGLFRSR
ncbi:MAG: hypothetical protein QXI93_05435 [Candidatus Methanomethylicia archaeon]